MCVAPLAPLPPSRGGQQLAPWHCQPPVLRALLLPARQSFCQETLGAVASFQQCRHPIEESGETRCLGSFVPVSQTEWELLCLLPLWCPRTLVVRAGWEVISHVPYVLETVCCSQKDRLVLGVRRPGFCDGGTWSKQVISYLWAFWPLLHTEGAGPDDLRGPFQDPSCLRICS